MPTSRASLETLFAWIGGLPLGIDRGSIEQGHVVVVDLDAGWAGAAADLHTGLPAVVVGLTTATEPQEHPFARACDVVLAPDDAALSAVVVTVERNPVSATALALLLRGSERRSVDDGLSAESAVYSAMQAGPEFASWRADRPRRERPRGGDGPAVLVDRVGSVLQICLNRPHVRNALDTAMRDGLVEALGLAVLDPSIEQVHLRGAGPDFCAGGDLDEFGSRPDPASAHLLRLQQSVGRAIDTVADRVTAHVHGACVGSGIELPAFAHRIVAHPSAVFSLPEVALGLVPGAGGTVSLPRRIGRHRTARLALTGERIDAAVARTWGLVDAVADDAAS